MFNKDTRGFTLIELLVVIAIIGILSSVVLASLNSARQKSRDARRIGDIKQMQLAMEMYYDSNSSYPADIATLVSSGFIPVAPTDPQTGTSTTYVYAVSADGSDYVLRSTLETAHSVLGGDIDGAADSAFTGSPDCSDTPNYYYCIQP